jgi:hypothetical protein
VLVFPSTIAAQPLLRASLTIMSAVDAIARRPHDIAAAGRLPMRATCVALILVFASAFAEAADDLRVLKLEQDVRNLERTVQDLTRQIQDLKLQLALSGGGPRVTVTPRPEGRASWLDAANWTRVQPGMSEAEVVAVLGEPTSAREQEGARVLFYAMELAPEGLLGGRVTLRDGRVADVAPPTLR